MDSEIIDFNFDEHERTLELIEEEEMNQLSEQELIHKGLEEMLAENGGVLAIPLQKKIMDNDSAIELAQIA